MSTVTMNISLTDDLKAFVEARIQARGYSFVLVSDYVGAPHPHSSPLPDPVSTAERLITALSRPPLPISPGGIAN